MEPTNWLWLELRQCVVCKVKEGVPIHYLANDYMCKECYDIWRLAKALCEL